MVGTLRSVGLKFGRWLDTVLMQRALHAAAAAAVRPVDETAAQTVPRR
jgi:hypothetical protein